MPVLATPSTGLDSSWVTGITWARQLGLRFGSSIDFTYGPWGLIDYPTLFSGWMYWLWVLAFATSAVALLTLLRRILRARLSRFASGMLLLLVATPALLPYPSFSTRGVLICIAIAFAGQISTFRRYDALLAAGAVTAGLVILVKFSSGSLAIGFVVLGALLAQRTISRRLIGAGGALVVFVIALLVFWLAGRQRLGDIPGWLRASLELTSGYPDAMSVEQPEGLWSYLLIAVVVIGAVVVLIRRTPRRAVAVSSVVLLLATAVVGVRAGFTRDDLGHETQTFQMLLVALLCAGTLVVVRFRWSAVAAGACAFGALLAGGTALTQVVDPVLRVAASRQTLTVGLNGHYRQDLTDGATGDLQSAYGLPRSILRAVEGRSVHIDPYAVNVAWSYQLDWDPVPVFQTYSAYTPYLDELNTRALRSQDGPQSVIRQATGTIDGRNTLWDSPRYMEALVCDFTPSATSGQWLALDRSPDRCSRATSLGDQHVVAGQTIDIPVAPDSHTMVIATLTLDPDPLNAAATAIFKPLRPLRLTVDKIPYRLPRGEASGPLIMRMASTSGWGPAFGGAWSGKRLTLSQGATVHFTAVTVG